MARTTKVGCQLRNTLFNDSYLHSQNKCIYLYAKLGAVHWSGANYVLRGYELACTSHRKKWNLWNVDSLMYNVSARLCSYSPDRTLSPEDRYLVPQHCACTVARPVGDRVPHSTTTARLLTRPYVMNICEVSTISWRAVCVVAII